MLYKFSKIGFRDLEVTPIGVITRNKVLGLDEPYSMTHWDWFLGSVIGTGTPYKRYSPVMNLFSKEFEFSIKNI